jgi:YARHG domain
MNKIILTISLIFLISCKKEEKTNVSVSELTVPVEENQTMKDTKSENILYGNWVGDFNSVEGNNGEDEYTFHKINLVIENVEDNKVSGHSIVAGNLRPFEGIINIKNENHSEFEVKEPGDDKYDGEFKFDIQNDTLSGVWSSFNKKIRITDRSYKLTKKEFRYDSSLILSDKYRFRDNYNKKTHKERMEESDPESEYVEETFRTANPIVRELNASTTILNEKQLKNLKKLELEIIENTIYARHGYSFKKKVARQFFDVQDWYFPISIDVKKDLTEIEKTNIKLLQRFQKYAKDSYESFGR